MDPYRAVVVHYPEVAVLFVTGVLLLLAGILIGDAWEQHKRAGDSSHGLIISKAGRLLPRRLTGLFRAQLAGILIHDGKMDNRAVLLAVGCVISGILLACLTLGMAQLWYASLLLLGLSLLLPFYLVTLVLDFYKVFALEKNIPRFLDEFRSAYVQTGRIRESFRISSRHVGHGMGRMLRAIADAPDMDMDVAVGRMAQTLNSEWIDIFVSLIRSNKEQGGDLASQLHNLNTTMGRVLSQEKKKNYRLIGYEFFAAGVAIASLPAVMYVSRLVLWDTALSILDADANSRIARIILWSMRSLVTVRVIRKLA